MDKEKRIKQLSRRLKENIDERNILEKRCKIVCKRIQSILKELMELNSEE